MVKITVGDFLECHGSTVNYKDGHVYEVVGVEAAGIRLTSSTPLLHYWPSIYVDERFTRVVLAKEELLILELQGKIHRKKA